MPDLSCSPDDYASPEAYAHAMATLAAYAHAMATLAAHDDRDWAIGGTEPGHYEVETEYAIEPQAGGYARGVDSELAGPIEELSDYAAGARIITRQVHYGPWRYVTPEEIENA